MKLLYSCRYFSIILSLLQFTDTFFHYLLYVHYQEVSHVSTLHLFRHSLSGFAPQTHFILYLRHTDHSPCLKCSVCFCCRKKYKTGKRNRFSHRDKFCHFPFAGAGCHLTPVVKPVTGKQFYPDFIFLRMGLHSFMTSIIRQLQTSNYVKMHFSPQKSLPGTLLFSRKIKGFPRIRNISSTPAITFPTLHPSAVYQKVTAT